MSMPLIIQFVVCISLPQLITSQLGSNSFVYPAARRFTPPPKNAKLKELCDACSFGGAGGMCREIDEQCYKSLCITMCLQKTWDCEIKITGGPPGLKEQVADPRAQMALCSQFKAYGCAKHMEACPFPDKKQDWLWQWADQRTYGGYFPSPILPAQACMHDPEDKETAKKYCSACKASVTLKELDCPFVNPPSNDDAKDPKKSQIPLNPQAFANADGIKASEQIPAHKSYAVRCEAVKKVFLAKKGKMEADFKKKACSCLGCCDEDPSCYFSPTENSMETLDEYKRLRR
jgi:hypothetical protein